MTYGISSRAYLDRAKKQFAKKSRECLIYAALELRCAIESRLQEILEPHEHISKKSKQTYRLSNLSQAITKKSLPDGYWVKGCNYNRERTNRIAVYSSIIFSS